MFIKDKLLIIFFIIKNFFILYFFGFNKLLTKIKNSKCNKKRKFDKNIYISASNFIERIGHRLPFLSCLIKASAFKSFFINDDSIKLVIGVKKYGDEIESHAWIAQEDLILLNNDLMIDQYSIIFKL